MVGGATVVVGRGGAVVVGRGAAVVVVAGTEVVVVDEPGTVLDVDDRGTEVDEVDPPEVGLIDEFRIRFPASATGNLHGAVPLVAFDMKLRQMPAGIVPPATCWPLKLFISRGCS